MWCRYAKTGTSVFLVVGSGGFCANPNMIVTVTLSPSLDRTLSVPMFNPGTLNQARLIRVDLGGKGINVSRALRALDLPS
jgi:hypothetical protein